MNNKYKPFSEREGYAQPKSFQKEKMDRDLRNGLWNAFYRSFPKSHAPVTGHALSHPIHEAIRDEFLNEVLDEYKDYMDEDNDKVIKGIYQSGEFHKVFNLIEFVIKILPSGYEKNKAYFVGLSNDALVRENSAYRIVEGLVTPIIEEHEIAAIETAMQTHGPAKEHIKKAHVLFSDRENPHYENSIKESIHAVESIAKEITGKTDKPLNALTQQLKLHPNLTNALNELYNWTSKDGGIRHSKSEKSLTPDQATARYMLVTCSAFVNYIIARNLNKK